MPAVDPSISRRNFLRFLAGSPLLASSGYPVFAHETPSRLPDPMAWAPRDFGELIKSPQDAINVFDFEPVAYKNIPPAHFGYMASASTTRSPCGRTARRSTAWCCGRAGWST
jgi:hypothetical protein